MSGRKKKQKQTRPRLRSSTRVRAFAVDIDSPIDSTSQDSGSGDSGAAAVKRMRKDISSDSEYFPVPVNPSNSKVKKESVLISTGQSDVKPAIIPYKTEDLIHALKAKGRTIKEKEKKPRRGPYCCARCGQPKKNHVCKLPDVAPVGRTKLYIPEAPTAQEVPGFNVVDSAELSDSHPVLPILPTTSIQVSFTNDQLGAIPKRDVSMTGSERIRDAMIMSKNAADAISGRSDYFCGVCGEKKKGHVCKGAPTDGGIFMRTRSNNALIADMRSIAASEGDGTDDIELRLPPQYKTPADGRISPISIAPSLTHSQSQSQFAGTTSSAGNPGDIGIGSSGQGEHEHEKPQEKEKEQEVPRLNWNGLSSLGRILTDAAFPSDYLPRDYTVERLLDTARAGHFSEVKHVLDDALAFVPAEAEDSGKPMSREYTTDLVRLRREADELFDEFDQFND